MGRHGVPGPAAVLLLVAFFSFFPRLSDAAAPFSGYADPVRILASRVVESSGPGREEELARAVRLLSNAMHAHGILSLNEIPDRVFERAVREGWRAQATPSLRQVAEVAPLSVQLWAWLAKEDALALRLDQLARDLDGLTGSVRRFGPALLGYASWLLSLLAAAICWFATWASIALFLRARPSLESDLSRLFRIPWKAYAGALAAAGLFLLPLVAGVGLAVAAAFWLAVSAGYLRRGELLMMGTTIGLLVALLAGGSLLHSLRRMAGEVQRGGWMGTEGYYPEVWPDLSSLPAEDGEGASFSWLLRFSRARAAMLAGKPAEAERRWSELIREGRDRAEIRNNLGIALAQQGRLKEALAEFEAALRKAPGDPPALWNAYNVSLRLFDLERARVLQPVAWSALPGMSPYHFRPTELGQEAWLASALDVGAIWESFFALRGGWAGEAGDGDLFRLFFRPLAPGAAIVFLSSVLLAAGLWKALSLKIWIHRTCRACGLNTLIVGGREAHAFCNLCRVGVGWDGGLSGEQDRRGQGIAMHRFYVRACSLLVPGSGGLWSGKELRTLGYGLLLALSLGAVSSSVGARGGGAIVSDLRGSFVPVAIALAVIVWVGGAAWGLRSFRRMQQGLGIAGARR